MEKKRENKIIENTILFHFASKSLKKYDRVLQEISKFKIFGTPKFGVKENGIRFYIATIKIANQEEKQEIENIALKYV